MAAHVREELKAKGGLGQSEALHTVRSLGWTAIQKRDRRRYQAGQMIGGAGDDFDSLVQCFAVLNDNLHEFSVCALLRFNWPQAA